MVQLIIEIDGEKQVTRTLAAFRDRITDASPQFDQIATDIAGFEERQFNTEGRFSTEWAPLSPAYGRWKARRYPGKPILERTGELRKSLTQRPFGIERINSSSVEVGTAVPYSRFHQFGTSRMPQRRPLEVPRSTRSGFVKSLQRFIVTGDVTANSDAR